MHQFLFASSENIDARSLVGDCLGQLGEIPATANLGFCYATDPLAGDMREILSALQKAAPAVHWVGTVGVGICVGAREIYDRPALALMIGSLPAGDFRVIPDFRGHRGALSRELIDWWQAQPYCFALIHGDPGNPDTPAFINGLAGDQGTLFLNGGLTSSQGGHNPQLADGTTHNGLSGVICNDQVQIMTDHTQGCSPVGPVHEITRARKHIAISLDHHSALKVMKTDIGEVLARDLTRIGGYIFAALPIPGSDTGDYLVRNLVGIDPDQGLVAVGDNLENQRQLMFCRRDGNSAREDMDRMLDRLEKRIQGRTIRGGVYITCLGRGRHQFGENSEELKMISRRLGAFPLVGFFANGEIYNGRLYGYTGVLTLFL